MSKGTCPSMTRPSRIWVRCWVAARHNCVVNMTANASVIPYPSRRAWIRIWMLYFCCGQCHERTRKLAICLIRVLSVHLDTHHRQISWLSSPLKSTVSDTSVATSQVTLCTLHVISIPRAVPPGFRSTNACPELPAWASPPTTMSIRAVFRHINVDRTTDIP